MVSFVYIGAGFQKELRDVGVAKDASIHKCCMARLRGIQTEQKREKCV